MLPWLKFMFNFTPIPDVCLIDGKLQNRDCTISEVISDNKIKNNNK